MAMNMAEPTLENPSLAAPTIEELTSSFPQLELLSLLGRGGMGIVYLARQPQLDRTVALKILAPECSDNPRFADRFQREAISLAKLDHPNIVTIFDTGVSDGHYYLIMEYVEGLNLREAMAGEKMAPAEALAIVPEICAGLQYAHDHGIVHRDIKPENILLDKKGRVKIADFGIAKLIHGPELDSPHSEQQAQDLTQESKLGTPKYMAPEQGHAPEEADHRADIYALGAVFYEMLTGERPQADLLAPSQKVSIDVRIDEIVLRALKKEPELRFQTAHEFSTQVQTLSGQTATQTKPQPSPADEPPNRPAQAWRKWFPIPWVRQQEGHIKPNWFAIIPLLSACLFIIWGGINAIFIHPWDNALKTQIVRLVGTPLILAWIFLSYRLAHSRTLEGKRLLGLSETTGKWWLTWIHNFAMGITIACLIRSFFMPFSVGSDRMSPQLEKGSLVFVERLNKQFNQGEIIAYKEGERDFFGLVAKTRSATDSSKDLLVTDQRGKEFTVPIRDIYGRAMFGSGRPKVDQLPKATQTLPLTNSDQSLSKKTTTTTFVEQSPEEIAFGIIHQADIPMLTVKWNPWFDIETNTSKVISDDPEFADSEAKASAEIIDFHLEMQADHPAVLWRKKHKIDLTGWPDVSRKTAALIFSNDSTPLVTVKSSDFSTITLAGVQTLLKHSSKNVPGTEDPCFAFETTEGNTCLIKILERGTFEEAYQPFKIQYRISQ